MKPTNYIMSVFGKKGSGKSVFANWWIEKFRRVIIFDTMGCFENAHYIYIYRYKDFLTLVNEIFKSERVEFRICLRLSKIDFEKVNRAIYLYIKDVIYVVDEIQTYTTAKSIPYYFNLLITTGRHKRISIITISQRPSNIPNIILSNTDYLVIFETNLKRDLDTFSTFKYCERENIESLRDYEFYFVDLKHKLSNINKISIN